MIFEKWAEENNIPDVALMDLQDRLDMVAVIKGWATNWGIDDETLAKLLDRLGVGEPPKVVAIRPRSEAAVSSVIKLEAADYNIRLTRNNVGVLKDINGRPVRYGAWNENKEMNELYKSPDLIGIRPVKITPDLIGKTIGQFVGREAKKEGWKFNPKSKHEQAQERCHTMINLAGGDARFVSDVGSFDD